jgi:hypothetical protein
VPLAWVFRAADLATRPQMWQDGSDLLYGDFSVPLQQSFLPAALMFTRPTSRLLLGMAVLGAASFGFAASPSLANTFPCVVPDTCAEGAYDAVGDKIIDISTLPATAGAGLSFTESSGVYSLTVDYGSQIADVGDILAYAINIDTTNFPAQAFKTVSLSYNAVGSTVEKFIYSSNAAYEADPDDTLAILSITNPTYNVSPGIQSLFIVDYVSANGGTIASFTNSFTQYTGVPGPLPLMGAGAAFGFSRRLRRRTRQAYNLG